VTELVKAWANYLTWGEKTVKNYVPLFSGFSSAILLRLARQPVRRGKKNRHKGRNM
jgi:hypothetical protein